jgi:hypothetical protein
MGTGGATTQKSPEDKNRDAIPRCLASSLLPKLERTSWFSDNRILGQTRNANDLNLHEADRRIKKPNEH